MSISTDRLESVIIIFKRTIIPQSLKQYFYLAAATVSVLTSLRRCTPRRPARSIRAAATADTAAAAVIDTRGNAAAAAAATTAYVQV